MTQSDFGYQVYPHTAKNGVTVLWNAVVYDLTRWRDYPSGRRYRFVAVTKPHPSVEQTEESAIRLCHQHQSARRRRLL